MKVSPRVVEVILIFSETPVSVLMAYLFFILLVWVSGLRVGGRGRQWLVSPDLKKVLVRSDLVSTPKNIKAKMVVRI